MAKLYGITTQSIRFFEIKLIIFAGCVIIIFLVLLVNIWYVFIYITDFPVLQILPHISPLLCISTVHDFFFNFYFYLGSLDSVVDFSSTNLNSILPWWFDCLGKRHRDKTPDIEMLGRKSTDSRGVRHSDLIEWRWFRPDPSRQSQIEAAKRAEGENAYAHGFGFDVSGIDKGKGKAKILNISNEADRSNESPKESMESSTTSNSRFSFVYAHYPDPVGLIQAAKDAKEKARCINPSSSGISSSSIPSGSGISSSSIPSGSENPRISSCSSSSSENSRISSLYYSKKYPLAPFNSPASTREEITGASGSGGGWGWVSNLLENIF